MPRDIRGRAGDGLYGRPQRRLAVVPAYDLPLTPALAVPPFEHGIQGPGEIGGGIVEPFHRLSLTFPFNLTGQPAATVTAPMWLFERQLPSLRRAPVSAQAGYGMGCWRKVNRPIDIPSLDGAPGRSGHAECWRSGW